MPELSVSADKPLSRPFSRGNIYRIISTKLHSPDGKTRNGLSVRSGLVYEFLPHSELVAGIGFQMDVIYGINVYDRIDVATPTVGLRKGEFIQIAHVRVNSNNIYPFPMLGITKLRW